MAKPIAGEGNAPAPPSSRQAAEFFFEAFADALLDRLEHRQEARRRLLTLEQAAEYLAMSEDTVERLVANKRLIPVGGLDRRRRFDIRDLDKLINEAKGRRDRD